MGERVGYNRTSKHIEQVVITILLYDVRDRPMLDCGKEPSHELIDLMSLRHVTECTFDEDHYLKQ